MASQIAATSIKLLSICAADVRCFDFMKNCLSIYLIFGILRRHKWIAMSPKPLLLFLSVPPWIYTRISAARDQFWLYDDIRNDFSPIFRLCQCIHNIEDYRWNGGTVHNCIWEYDMRSDEARQTECVAILMDFNFVADKIVASHNFICTGCA